MHVTVSTVGLSSSRAVPDDDYKPCLVAKCRVNIPSAATITTGTPPLTAICSMGIDSAGPLIVTLPLTS
jgi:hypothetical protein